jgi:hypothetical protein
MKEGFLVNKGEYACVPYVNGYIIIHNGQQLEKVCRTEGSAHKYIEEHKKSTSKGKLPVD